MFQTVYTVVQRERIYSIAGPAILRVSECSSILEYVLNCFVRRTFSSTRKDSNSGPGAWDGILRGVEEPTGSKSNDNKPAVSSSQRHDMTVRRTMVPTGTFLPTGKDSIFGSESGAWNQILKGATGSKSNINKPVVSSSRRQGMTARETKVLTGMLDMIFDSNSGNKPPTPVGAGGDEPVVFKQGKVDDFFGRLRRHSKHGKWMDDLDANLLDQKKEQIGYCNSDQELLDWAIREVFEESKQFEAAARRAIAEAAKSPGLKDPPRLQPSTYPHMIPILMRTFRDKYRDPHLALSIFNYAKSLSIVSYVFGCSTEAYNELIQTKWERFRDLPGVYQSINEMIVNGVPVNTRTRKWVETVRRDVLSQKERLDNMDETGQNGVWELLTKIDQAIANNDAQQGSKARWESWKSEVIKDMKDNKEDDNWSFDNWGDMFKNKQTYKRGTTRADHGAVLPAPTFN